MNHGQNDRGEVMSSPSGTLFTLEGGRVLHTQHSLPNDLSHVFLLPVQYLIQQHEESIRPIQFNANVSIGSCFIQIRGPLIQLRL